jgi:preprotein translocase subunit SecG
MAILYPFLIVIHILICMALIIVVLLQSSKGEGLAGAFGGSGLTGAVFGGRGAATFLSKSTTILAIAFMITSITLTLLSFTVSGPGTSGVIENLRTGQNQPAPMPPSAVPGEAPPPGADTGSAGAGGIFDQLPGQQGQPADTSGK